MVQHLQGRAQRIGGRPGVATLTVKIKQLPSDRRGRVAAIRYQIVPVVIAQFRRIQAKGAQHVVRNAARWRFLVSGIGSGGIAVAVVRESGPGAPPGSYGHAVEPADFGRPPAARGVVGDVVGAAGKAVEGVDVRAQIAADQKRADREILAAAPLPDGVSRPSRQEGMGYRWPPRSLNFPWSRTRWR